MLFGFNVVSLYYIMKMYNMMQLYAFNEANRIFNKQSDLKRLDIFGLMGRLSDPTVISQLGTVGHALLDKDKTVSGTFGYRVQGRNKHLEYIILENEQFKMNITIEQQSFLNDNVSLFKLSMQAGNEECSEFFTREAYYIDWIGETVQEFDWIKVKKIEQKDG
jgi:hypothetical protein